jgi:hypothetical protein
VAIVSFHRLSQPNSEITATSSTTCSSSKRPEAAVDPAGSEHGERQLAERS